MTDPLKILASVVVDHEATSSRCCKASHLALSVEQDVQADAVRSALIAVLRAQAIDLGAARRDAGQAAIEHADTLIAEARTDRAATTVSSGSETAR